MFDATKYMNLCPECKKVMPLINVIIDVTSSGYQKLYAVHYCLEHDIASKHIIQQFKDGHEIFIPQEINKQ